MDELGLDRLLTRGKKMMSWEKNVISLDTETTGLSVLDEMLSIAICDARTGKEIWNKLYKPDVVESWPEAQRVNGISPEMVKDCPSVKDDLKQLREIILGADAVVVYNSDFDIPFLEDAGILKEGDKFNCYDPMLDFAVEYGEWSEYHGDYKWQRLTTAADYIGYEWTGNAHDACADCMASAAVWRWLWSKDKAKEFVWEVYS